MDYNFTEKQLDDMLIYFKKEKEERDYFLNYKLKSTFVELSKCLNDNKNYIDSSYNNFTREYDLLFDAVYNYSDNFDLQTVDEDICFPNSVSYVIFENETYRFFTMMGQGTFISIEKEENFENNINLEDIIQYYKGEDKNE